MINNDYSKAVGRRSVSPVLPWPAAVAVLALGAGAMWFGVTKLQEIPKPRSAHEQAHAPAQPKPQHHAAQR